MSAFSAEIAKAIAMNYAGPQLGKIIDIGGGQGALLAALLQSNPDSTGVLLERSDVIVRAKQLMED